MNTQTNSENASASGVGSSGLLGGKAGDVTSLETRYIVQCKSHDDDWYDFSIHISLGEATSNIGRVRQYREGTYRLIRRKTQDVLLAS